MKLKDLKSFKALLETCKSSTYICSVCGNIIFPEIEFNNGADILLKEASE